MDNSCATTSSGGLRVAQGTSYILTYMLVCTLGVDTYTVTVTVVFRRVHTWVTSSPVTDRTFSAIRRRMRLR